jgi:hypothetical protein
MTARTRASFVWRRRNSTGSAPAAAATSSTNDSSATTFAYPPSVRSAEVRREGLGEVARGQDSRGA